MIHYNKYTYITSVHTHNLSTYKFVTLLKIVLYSYAYTHRHALTIWKVKLASRINSY